MLELYYGDWQGRSEKDLLPKGVLSDPNRVAIYDRGADQTEGIEAVSDGYGFNKMATAMQFKSGQLAAFYLSSNLCAKLAKNWSEDERVFLEFVVDQLSSAMELSANEFLQLSPSQKVSIFMNKDGRGILGFVNSQRSSQCTFI